MRYLLDTNILSDLLRHPEGSVAAQIVGVGEGAVCTSIVVAAELRYGAAKRRSTRLMRAVEGLLARIEVLPLDTPSDASYAELRADLEARGEPIGPNDLLIAAHALTLGITLVTGNTREFERVRGLKIENWLRAH